MQLPKNPIIKDALVTGVLAVVVLAVVWSAGGAASGTGPASNLERKVRSENISFIKKQTILSHFEETLPSGSVIVHYTYLGEKLPEKLAEDEVPALRTDSSWTRQKGMAANGQAVYEAIAFPSPQYVQYLNQWYRLEHGQAPKETYDAANRSLFSYLVSVAHAISVNQFDHTGDGQVSSYNAVWSTAHDATSGSLWGGASYTSDTVSVTVFHHTSAGKLDLVPQGYRLSRAFFPFDTSVIPLGATITAASLNLYATGTPVNTDNDGSDYLTVVQTSQAAEYNIIDEDFDQCGAVSSPTEGIDAGQRKDITSISANAYFTFTLNATGRGWIKTNGQASNCGSTNIYLYSGTQTTWTVPNDWSASNNTIEVIGAGGGGYYGATGAANSGGAGGGGGGYSKVTNVSLPPGGTIGISMGVNGAGGSPGGSPVAPTAGGDTYLCNSTSNCSSISDTAVVVGAKGGSAATDPGSGTASGGGGAGGSSSSGVGTTKFSGGAGGNRNGLGGGGGGGSGSSNGNGAAGGAGGSTSPGSGGGGGGNGGGTAGASTGSTTGGAGGNNSGGTGGGAGGVGGNQPGASGTAGGGGGGGGSSTTIQGGPGGTAGNGTEWDSTHGTSGGGGGGGGSTAASQSAGYGGSAASSFNGFGGGGGGGGGESGASSFAGGGGTGGYGAIIITYANAAKGTTCLGVREGHDTTNSAVTTDTENTVVIASSENTGTTADPYLSITYSAPFAFWQFQDF